MAGTELASAYISLFPKLKTNEIEAQLKNVKVDNAGTVAGNSFGTSFVKAFKAIAGMWMVQELARGFAELTSAAVKSYASYEQLLGGVKKIFDEMDYSRILEDADNAYYELNMSANEYLEVINQTGAAFAATMGDERGYDTARQGLKAISNYASGTGRNLDELSEKFSLITRSTSSYQSIADQFSGILPATSQGFLEQAQAAGILSEEYTKLTEVPIDEYQEAVAEMLERGVDQMGLTGNTAAETANTISGALAAVGAEWDNWLASLADDNADVKAETQELVDTLTTAAGLLVPRFGEIMESLGEGVRYGIVTALNGAIDKLLEGSPEVGDAALETFLKIVDAVDEIAWLVLEALGLLLLNMIAAIVRKIEDMSAGAFELMGGFARGIAEGFYGVFSELMRGLEDAVQKVRDKWQSFFDAGHYISQGLERGIASAGDRVANAAASIATKALNSAKSALAERSPSKKAFEIGAYFSEGMALGIADKASSVTGAVTDITSGMLSAASVSASPSLATAGVGAGSTTINLYCDIKDLQGIQTLNDLYDVLARARAINPTRR